MATNRMSNKRDDIYERLEALYEAIPDPRIKAALKEVAYMTDDLYYEATLLIDELESELAAATYTPDDDEYWADVADKAGGAA